MDYVKDENVTKVISAARLVSTYMARVEECDYHIEKEYLRKKIKSAEEQLRYLRKLCEEE